jgi:hypothetical protein
LGNLEKVKSKLPFFIYSIAEVPFFEIPSPLHPFAQARDVRNVVVSMPAIKAEQPVNVMGTRFWVDEPAPKVFWFE